MPDILIEFRASKPASVRMRPRAAGFVFAYESLLGLVVEIGRGPPKASLPLEQGAMPSDGFISSLFASDFAGRLIDASDN